ncbi:UNVERIFIED_CONTAM: hypothetical protein HDU68_010626 [Siphonaria sp. JEL0065]|nr:hypothetical protein HDU68_010626 [Siphonaria sp. JEL0065]
MSKQQPAEVAAPIGSDKAAIVPALAADKATRKPNQLKALSRKTIAFQRRQMFTNICCICMCPLMMVVISAMIGALINGLIAKSQPSEDILYCGNNASLTPTGFPIFNSSDPGVYGVNVTNGKSVNYLVYFNFGNLNGPPGAQLLNIQHPCNFWFGDSYPKNSPIYERNADLNGSAKADTTYVPPPDGGWLAQLSNPSTFATSSFRWFIQLQQSNWAVVGAKKGLEGAFGSLPDLGPLNLAQGLQLSANASAILAPHFQSNSGLLGSISQRLYVNFTTSTTPGEAPYALSNFKLFPYFAANNSVQSSEDVDTIISEQLSTIIAGLASLDKRVLLQSRDKQKAADLLAFQLAANTVTAKMPYGGLFLEDFNAETGQIRLVFHYGTDKRIASSSSFPFQGFRLLETVAQIGQASLRSFGAASQNTTLAQGTVTQGIRAFPQTVNTAFSFPFGGLIGRILYPFGVSFLLPIFVIMLVKEKEDRIYIMMKMNGVKTWAYYLSHYVTFFILFFISTLVFIVVGKGAKLDMFTKTSPAVLVVLFLLWGNAQIVLAFLISTLFSKSRIALVMTFLVVLVGVVISLVLANLYSDGFQSAFLNIWPPFAFYRGLSLMNTASITSGALPFGPEQFQSGTEFSSICRFLFAEIFVYGGLAVYFNQVLPTEFGITRPWHFPVTDLIALVQSNKRKKENGGIDIEGEHHLAIAATETLDSREDDDVRAERARVDAGQYSADATIVMSHMKKVYPSRKGLGPKVGVRDVTFAEEAGVIFGLLGPNGAGKTTLINILTGLYESSGGQARLAGFDIKNETSAVYNSIGVCPQFDILWEDLTVEEHLYFYARLKGVAGGRELDAVNQSLNQVSLEALRNRLSKTLSGGEKRRLSIAIALVGDPSVVFLDEPTTGLDPEVRRLIWNIIQGARDNKTIILTTHSMEEAETLCQRIGIMAKGSLRCIGQPLRLKELYGTGFKLSFYSQAENTERACKFVESVLPVGWRKIDAFSTTTAYEFPAAAGAIPELFEKMEREKEANGIAEWGISQTTLEEVFIKIISDDDANAD